MVDEELRVNCVALTSISRELPDVNDEFNTRLQAKDCEANWTRDPGDKLTGIGEGTQSNPSGESREQLWNATASAYCLVVSAPASTFSLRKEVIQPQVLLRLPCYDFTPIMNHTLGRCLPCGLARRLLVQSTFVM